MATRCDIIVKHPLGEIKFYHHWDGYPSGVGFQLLELIDSFPIYKSVFGGEEDPTLELNKFIRALADIKEGGEYEFSFSKHTDIEFRYIINIKTRELQCLEGAYEYDESADGEVTCEFETYRTHDVRKLYDEATAREAQENAVQTEELND